MANCRRIPTFQLICDCIFTVISCADVDFNNISCILYLYYFVYIFHQFVMELAGIKAIFSSGSVRNFV